MSAPDNNLSPNAKVGIFVYAILVVVYLSTLGLWLTAVFLGTLAGVTSGSPTGFWLTMFYPAVVLLTFLASAVLYQQKRFTLAFWVGFIPALYALLLLFLIFF